MLRIVQTPHDGSRKVVRDADGVYSEQYGATAVLLRDRTSERIRRQGKAAVPHLRRWSRPALHPGILDILKSHGVRATFFIIGANADQNIGLVKREYAEGHDIGNHTYTHPNIALVSPKSAPRWN